ncbi:MAG: HD domain-containing protein, partial [Phycisphaerales bacterium]|nr:HD domain-containing protein [Phycisphaerales bacterium]
MSSHSESELNPGLAPPPDGLDLSREHAEPEVGADALAPASPFDLDRDRVIHSSAFRRLQFKTQAFGAGEGDNIRTRLAHTLEVANLARRIAQQLGLCVELAEVAALGHDLGHPPFGHAGEAALNERTREFGGF